MGASRKGGVTGRKGMSGRSSGMLSRVNINFKMMIKVKMHLYEQKKMSGSRKNI